MFFKIVLTIPLSFTIRVPLVRDGMVELYAPQLDASAVRRLNDVTGVNSEPYCQALLLEGLVFKTCPLLL